MPNRSSKPKRPRDTSQLAKFITDLATGEAELPKTEDGKDPAAVALGRRGGLKGGKARAASLTKERRSEIAREAAALRWKDKAATQSEGARGRAQAHPKRRTKISTPEG
jgi:hypothetical protein